MPSLVPIGLNQMATLLLGVLGIKLVSHVVPPRVFGEYGLFLTLTLIGPLLTHSGVTNYASRYWQREKSRAGAYQRFLLAVAGRASIFLLILLLAVTAGVSAFRLEWVWLTLLPLLWVSNLGGALITLTSLLLNASEKHWSVLMLNILSAAGRAFLPAAVAVLLGATLFVVSAGYALQAGVVSAVALWWWWRSAYASAAPGLDAQWRQELRDFGRPFIWMGVGAWLLQNADRWIVALFYGNDQAGLFNMASNIASIVPGLVLAGLMQKVFPGVFRQADNAKDEEDWRRLARQCDRATLIFLGASFVGLGCLHWLGPKLVGWLISEDYRACMPLLAAGGMAAVATQVNQFQYLLLQGQHNSSAMVRVMLWLAVIRTGVALVAGAWSWSVLLAWLFCSTLLVAWLGRMWIQRAALADRRPLQPDVLTDSFRG